LLVKRRLPGDTGALARLAGYVSKICGAENAMSTAVLPKVRVRREAPPNRIWDRVFFSGMILFVLATAIIGFWPTYYGAGVIHAPLPSALVHVHAVVVTLWLVLLVVQSALISAKRVRVHKTLGIAGFGLAAVMIVLGFMTGVAAMRRGATVPPIDPRTFMVLPLGDIFVFTVLIVCAGVYRYKPVLHKRYVLFGTIMMLDAALGRVPYQHHPGARLASSLFLLFAPLVYDLVSLRRVTVATWASELLIVVVFFFRFPVAQTAAWLRFADLLKG
jgi:hypothetical protein